MARKQGERPRWLGTDNRIQLLVPVEYHVGVEAQRITELQLKRLTAADMMILDEPLTHTEKLLRILEGQTALMRVVLVKLDAVDLGRIDDCLGYFMEPGSVTGGTS